MSNRQIRFYHHYIRERVVHGHSGGVIPGPISNPEVKSSCVVFCTVVREPTGTYVAVPLFFTSPHQHSSAMGVAILFEKHR